MKRMDPAIYGQAFYNGAFEGEEGEGEDKGGTVKSVESGIYESIRFPDPNYQSLDREKKQGSVHSTHGYLSIDRKNPKASNFDALRDGVIGANAGLSDDGYEKPVTLTRDKDNMESTQINPLFQKLERMNSYESEPGYSRRQDSGYHSNRQPNYHDNRDRSHHGYSDRDKHDKYRDRDSSHGKYKRSYHDDNKRYKESRYDKRHRSHENHYADRRPVDPRDDYGSGAAIFETDKSQKNPLYIASNQDLRSRSSQGHQRSSKAGSAQLSYSGSRHGNKKEEQGATIDLSHDNDLSALYDRADNISPHKVHPDLESQYDRADNIKVQSKPLRSDLDGLYDRADSVPYKNSSKPENLYDKADRLIAIGNVPLHDLTDLYDRADNVSPNYHKPSINSPEGLYDRADGLRPSSGHKVQSYHTPSGGRGSHHRPVTPPVDYNSRASTPEPDYETSSAHGYLKVYP